MGCHVLVMGLLVLGAPELATPHPREILEAADQVFTTATQLPSGSSEAQHAFAKAARGYEALQQAGYQSAALSSNQGNAYLLAGDLPRAIQAYRRGLRLVPGDRLLRQNLAYARAQVVYPNVEDPERLAGPVLPQLGGWSWRERLLILGVVHLVAWIALVYWLLDRRGWLLVLSMICFISAGTLATGLAQEARCNRRDESQPLAIIAHDGVVLRTGNGPAYPARLERPLGRGVEARCLFARDPWLQIELPGGEVGWVRREEVLLDPPCRSQAVELQLRPEQALAVAALIEIFQQRNHRRRHPTIRYRQAAVEADAHRLGEVDRLAP